MQFVMKGIKFIENVPREVEGLVELGTPALAFNFHKHDHDVTASLSFLLFLIGIKCSV